MRTGKKRAFSLQDVVAPRGIGSIAASCDGRVAFVVSEPAPDLSRDISRIWMLDADAPEGARPITSAEHQAASPRFAPDGGRLAYLSEGKDGHTQVALLTNLAEPQTVTRFGHGAHSFTWSPDGKTLLVLAAQDLPAARKKAIDLKDDARDVYGEMPASHMWLVAADGGKPRAIGPKGRHIIHAAWSPDAKRIAFLSSKHPHTDSIISGVELCVMDARGRNARVLASMLGLEAPGAAPAWSPDGTRIAFNSPADASERGPGFVRVIHVDTGKSVVLDRKSDQRSAAPRWLDSDTVLFFQSRGCRAIVRRGDTDGKSADTLVDLPGFVNDFCPTADGASVYFSYTEASRPYEVYRVDAMDGVPRQLTHLNRAFERVRHVPIEIIRWKSREGWDVEGVLYRPLSGRPPYATVVIPHGGPHWASHNAHDPFAQYYAANGFAVFMPNFRGSTGYGTTFYRAIHGDWGYGPADDIMRGVKALVRSGVADGKRLLLHGHSYGGYISAWLLGHTKAFRAAVALAPVINALSMWGTTDIPSFMDWGLKAEPRDRYDVFWRQSPVAYLHKASTPTLVMTGEKDARVPPGQAMELYQGLKSAGVDTAFVVFPREGHDIAEPRHTMDYMRRCVEWFRSHLGKDAPKRRA